MERLSSSERKTAGSQYLCGFSFAVLAKSLDAIFYVIYGK